MRTKTNSKSLKKKKKILKAAEPVPHLRDFNEQETDFNYPPEDEGRMANLTSVRHGSGYHRPAHFNDGRGPDDEVAA